MTVKYCFRLLSVTVILCVITVFFAAVPVSCRITSEGLEILESQVVCPKILSFDVEGNKKMSVLCSQPVSLENAIVKSLDETYLSEENTVSYDHEGCLVNIELKDPTVIGTAYVFTGKLKDKTGNSLTFSLPFTGFNERPARLLLTEIRTKHSTSAGVIKKGEYVELYVLKGGNTAGLELVSGSDGEGKKFCFPMVEVKTGQYITVHYRMLEEGDCVDETGEDLSISTGADSSPDSRDFWIDNKESRISDNDVIILRDSCRDLVVDGVLFSASDKNSWYYSGQKALSIEAYESGVWPEGSGTDKASCSDFITLTRTLSRLDAEEIKERFRTENIDENTVIESGKDKWGVVIKATPGAVNNTEIYKK